MEQETKVKYPDVKVSLIGEDGNALAILGRVRKALQRAQVPQAEIDAFSSEARSGDYDHLLQTVLAWITVE